MLWRGQAAKDAVKYQQRFGASLAAKEREFLRSVAERAAAAAEAARKSEQEAKRSLQEALAREKERVRKLEEQRNKIQNDLR
jgi:hypothetical protein